MRFFSTRDNQHSVSFKQALFQGLAPDGGLYVPEHFPLCLQAPYPNTLTQLAEPILTNFIDDIPLQDLRGIIQRAFSFNIPLVPMGSHTYLLELFHGPTLSFKDVGARFMANAMAYYLAKDQQDIKIIVATSGDTGSAIAHAFHNLPHISVYILYPSNKITQLQEQQMTTLGGNVHALEVTGTFDDCQKLVKQALADETLKSNTHITTANSINLARLLPQMVYHAWGEAQLNQPGATSIVPSGNLGNLTAAIYAKQIGAPIQHFISACNANSVFPEFLTSGEFHPRTSKQTLSNAMDVGHPSNFERIRYFYNNEIEKIRNVIQGISVTDEETLNQIRATYEEREYILDPHTAVGMVAANTIGSNTSPMIISATAHPAKFQEVIKRALGFDIPLPPQLADALNKKKQSQLISTDYHHFINIIKT